MLPRESPSLIERPRVSFCTTCKGRLHHLRQTYLANLLLNWHTYPNVEFVLLDYNSHDGLAGWVDAQLRHFIAAGVVSYFREETKPYWNMAHAKNVAHLVASGEIICNLDADNRAVPDFAEHLRHLMCSDHEDQGVVVHAPGEPYGHTDTCGRVALFRCDFLRLGGYNEEFRAGYGLEDHELVARAKAAGLRSTSWSREYEVAIRHSSAERASQLPVTFEESNSQSNAILRRTLESNVIAANQGSEWGHAELTRNFCEKIEVSGSSRGGEQIRRSESADSASLVDTIRTLLDEHRGTLQHPHGSGACARCDGAVITVDLRLNRDETGHVLVEAAAYETDDERLGVAGGLVTWLAAGNTLVALRRYAPQRLSGRIQGCDPESIQTALAALGRALAQTGA